jgi:hypothetical protein
MAEKKPKKTKEEATTKKYLEKLATKADLHLLRADISEKFMTKHEFYEFKDEILTGQDKMITILERLDQERVFTNEAVKRLEAQVEVNTHDIKVIKERLQIA